MITIYETALEKKGVLDYDGPVEADTSDVIYNILRAYGLHKRTEECMVLITLNSDLIVTGIFEVARGNIDEVIFELREIFKRACLVNASNIIVAHNHIMDDTEPSEDDIQLTKKLSACGYMLGIHLVDHIIVNMDGYTSMLEFIC